MGTNVRQGIVTNGLVLHLDAANRKSYTSGSTVWNDLSGNNLTGSLTNGPTFSNANGGTIVFDGVDDAVNVSSSLFLVGTGSFSVETFAYLNTSTGINSNGIFSTGETFPGTTANIGIQMTQRTCWIGNANIVQGLGDNNTDNFPLQQWFHAVFLRESDGLTLRLYVNGNQRFSSTFAQQYSINKSLAAIGRRYPNITNFSWVGNIPILKFYTRALSPQEVAQNYNALKSRFGLS